MTLHTVDLDHLRRCIELAREALDDGDEPFGSILVDAEGRVLVEDRNRVKDGDATRHPEFEIARWSAAHLTPAERAAATVYTSGEHCPMCAAAHACTRHPPNNWWAGSAGGESRLPRWRRCRSTRSHLRSQPLAPRRS